MFIWPSEIKKTINLYNKIVLCVTMDELIGVVNQFKEAKIKSPICVMILGATIHSKQTELFMTDTGFRQKPKFEIVNNVIPFEKKE